MGSCCGKSDKPENNMNLPFNKKPNKTPAKNPPKGKANETPNTGNDGQKMAEEPEDQKKSSDEKAPVKGGESAYGKVKALGKKEEKKKALPAANYNPSGLIAKESKEFQLVREYLGSKNYQLIESIGSGNYAEVYKAYMADRNRYVAVKVIDLTKTNDNYRIGFLPKEIEILRTLKHPSIIKTYEVSQTVNRIFMIMEFCQFGTVTDWLRDKGVFTEPNAWEMIKKVVEGLNHMHSAHKIAHRDLKLENILISDNKSPKISDFSYSVVVDEKERQSTTFCGSIPYFGPEILQRRPHNPFVSDMWSLGVCFYIMVNDGLPFKIDDEKEMLRKQLAGEWDFKKRVVDKLSNELKAMIRKMIEPDVTKRATIVAIMNDPWLKTPPKRAE